MKNILEFRKKSAPAIGNLPDRSAVNEHKFDAEEVPGVNASHSSQPVAKQLDFDVKKIVFQLPDEGMKSAVKDKLRRITISVSLIIFVVVGALAYIQRIDLEKLAPQQTVEFSRLDVIDTPVSAPESAPLSVPAQENIGTENKSLEEIGEHLVLNENWKSADLNEFLQRWNELGAETRETFQATDWYQKLVRSLEQNINAVDQNNIDLDSAVLLAYKLGILTTRVKVKKQLTVSAPVSLKETKASLNMDVTKSKAEIKQKSTSVSEKILPANESKQIEDASSSSMHEENLALADAKVEIPNPLRNSDTLASITSQFFKAYEMGDMKSLQKLLSNGVSYNGKTSRSAVKSAFQNDFTDTVSRTIHVKSLNWELSDETAKAFGMVEITTTEKSPANRRRIGGKFRIHSSQETEVKKLAGRIEIQLEQYDGKILITKLRLPD